MLKANQRLEAVAISIKPITEAPITLEFFNGNKYVGSDGIEYPGYSPVVIGEISTNPEDENYMSEEEFNKWAIDAYYDVDAYVNKGMTVLGMFQAAPNFSAIPVITRDHMMRAIAAKIEQNLWTAPNNGEIRVTMTQSSGGRTTNMPSREKFDPTDDLNLKVQEYINGSAIFEILADSFEAIKLDRNEFVTWEQLQAIITAGEVPIERLYTLDVENYVPEFDGDGVNKKYVDLGYNDLQAQINALLVGDVELKTDHIGLRNQDLESYTGFAVHQRDVNTENKVLITQLKNKTGDLDKRTGVPLQAYKTLFQDTVSLTYETIGNYDAVGQGTTDSLLGFNKDSGIYTIQNDSEGDQVSFEATFKVAGKPLPGQIVGYATIQLNETTVLHPVTGEVIEIPLYITTTAGNIHSVNVKDVNIRNGVEGEWNSGDQVSLAVKVTNDYETTGFPLTISEVHFDMINNRVLAESGAATGAGATNNLQVSDPLTESISGLSENQADINVENVAKLSEINGKLNSNYESEFATMIQEFNPLASPDNAFYSINGGKFYPEGDISLRRAQLTWTELTTSETIQISIIQNNGQVYVPVSIHSLVNKKYVDDNFVPVAMMDELKQEMETLKQELKTLREVNNG